MHNLSKSVFLVKIFLLLIVSLYGVLQIDNAFLSNDIITNIYEYDSDLLEHRPLVKLFKLIVDDYRFTYCILYFFFTIFVINSFFYYLGFGCLFTTIVFLAYWLIPNGASIYYTNIFYNGISLASILYAFTLSSKLNRLVLLFISFLVHPLAFFFIFYFFLMPGYLYLRKFYKTYIFFLIVNVFALFNLYSIMVQFNYAEKFEDALGFTLGIRDNYFLVVKLILFFFTSLAILRSNYVIFASESFRRFVIGSLFFAIAVLIVPDIPFIERFVNPQITIAFIVALSFFLKLILSFFSNTPISQRKLNGNPTADLMTIRQSLPH